VSRFSIWAIALLVAAIGSSEAWAWGSTAHRIINQHAVDHLPTLMSQLALQQSFLAAHASDADKRKSSDTAESPKHFLDLESYPDFQHLTPDLAALISRYGWVTVRSNGILTWATTWALDSLTSQFQRGDWSRAYQTAADLGHYVADAHQPLHCTVNYDGAQTGNTGIHSRYESDMINLYPDSLTVTGETVYYIDDPYTFVFQYVLRSNAFVDSILQADNAAKTASGWNGSGVAPALYYAVLWQKTARFTKGLVQEATETLASLWYTAWVNAGLGVIANEVQVAAIPGGFQLLQNYPNPFNPSTRIDYRTGTEEWVSMKVYDMLGREVANLLDERKEPGTHSIRFDARGLSAGIYFYRLRSGGSVQTRKMILEK
jgi:hypothetical protein